MQQGRTGWTWDAWLIVGGLTAAAIGGALLIGSVQHSTSSFGWFAYAPLTGGTFLPEPGLPGPRQIFGYSLAAVGLFILVWTAGYHRGPRALRLPPVGATRRTQAMVAALGAGAILLLLAGGSLLLGSAPALPLTLPEQVAPADMSVAYSSELVVAFDDEPAPLVLPSAGLLLAGLLVSAATLGWRTGQPAQGNLP